MPGGGTRSIAQTIQEFIGVRVPGVSFTSYQCDEYAQIFEPATDMDLVQCSECPSREIERE